MYQLKTIPEDFIVKEISNFKIQSSGKYLYYKLFKRNRNTPDVIRELARRLHLKDKQIGFAGNKDKQAVTEQLISFYQVGKDKVKNLDLNQVKLEFLGYGNEPITLGSHLGNYFEIVIRNLSDEKIIESKFIENYFDEQRFSGKNKEIGRLLVKKEFKTALILIDDKYCNQHLSEKPSDVIGALKELSTRSLKLYVNAYQSYLWNEMVKRYLENFKVIKRTNYSLSEFVFTDNADLNLQMPLVGFGLDLTDSKIKKIIEELMEQENLDFNDFIIKQIPQLSAEGELRKVFVEIKDLVIEKLLPDELNPGKKKVKVTFGLPKGSYATMAVRKMIF